jgi:hypothetical protein
MQITQISFQAIILIALRRFSNNLLFVHRSRSLGLPTCESIFRSWSGQEILTVIGRTWKCDVDIGMCAIPLYKCCPVTASELPQAAAFWIVLSMNGDAATLLRIKFRILEWLCAIPPMAEASWWIWNDAGTYDQIVDKVCGAGNPLNRTCLCAKRS